jgi:hypothetical protein
MIRRCKSQRAPTIRQQPTTLRSSFPSSRPITGPPPMRMLAPSRPGRRALPTRGQRRPRRQHDAASAAQRLLTSLPRSQNHLSGQPVRPTDTAQTNAASEPKTDCSRPRKPPPHQSRAAVPLRYRDREEFERGDPSAAPEGYRMRRYVSDQRGAGAREAGELGERSLPRALGSRVVDNNPPHGYLPQPNPRSQAR